MGVKSVSADYAKGSKISKREKTVEQMQSAFLIQLAEGKDAKEAFYSSLRAARTPEPKEDVYLKEDMPIQGSLKTAKSSIKITPEEVSKWLDVIAKAGPLIAAFFSWIENILPNNHNENPEPQTN